MDYIDYKDGGNAGIFLFQARERLMGLLLERLNPPASSKILSVGAGVGEDLRTSAKFGGMYALDSNPRAVELIPDELVVEKRVCNACEMPYDNSFFDVALAFDVFEHIEDHEGAVSEISRVLKPGGFLVFSVPAFRRLFGEHDVALEHFRRYDMEDAEKLLAGFDKIRIGYWGFSLCFPIMAKKIIGWRGRHRIKFPRPLDRALYALLSVENRMIEKGFSLPFGSTVFGVCRKPR